MRARSVISRAWEMAAVAVGSASQAGASVSAVGSASQAGASVSAVGVASQAGPGGMSTITTRTSSIPVAPDAITVLHNVSRVITLGEMKIQGSLRNERTTLGSVLLAILDKY